MISARLAALSLLAFAVASAQRNAGLPPRISALVPSGAKLVSENFTGVPTMAVATFTAERRIDVTRVVEYSLQIRAFDTNSPMWKMKESAYRRQLDARIATARRGLAPESANLGMFTADPVQETKTAWGSALTQRMVQHPPRAKQYVDYNCAYFGMVGGVVVELSVHRVPDDPAEANRWAETVFRAVSKLSVSNIGEK